MNPIRWSIVVLSTLAMALQGCADAAARGSRPDLRPWVSTSGMLSLMAPSPAPLPPAPTPGAKCANCRGTGKVGDGVTAITCPVCDGQGVVKAAPVESLPAAVSSDGGASFRVVCEDGVCRRIKIVQPPSSR